MKKTVSVFLVAILALALSLALMPAVSVAQGPATVNVTAPSSVLPGTPFVARINISQAANLNCYQIQLNYNKNVIQVAGVEGGTAGVTAGLVGATAIPVDMWSFYPAGSPSGSVRIVGRVPNNLAVNGSGYLAEVHFNVVGPVGGSTSISPADGPQFSLGLFDTNGMKMGTAMPWGAANVQVSAGVLAGDANGDGAVNMGDVTKVELIILGLAASTPGADANRDGVVNMGDVTRIELIILEV